MHWIHNGIRICGKRQQILFYTVRSNIPSSIWIFEKCLFSLFYLIWKYSCVDSSTWHTSNFDNFFIANFPQCNANMLVIAIGERNTWKVIRSDIFLPSMSSVILHKNEHDDCVAYTVHTVQCKLYVHNYTKHSANCTSREREHKKWLVSSTVDEKKMCNQLSDTLSISVRLTREFQCTLHACCK